MEDTLNRISTTAWTQSKLAISQIPQEEMIQQALKTEPELLRAYKKIKKQGRCEKLFSQLTSYQKSLQK